jgi:hypothetical protein
MTLEEYIKKDYYIQSRWSGFGLCFLYGNCPTKIKHIHNHQFEKLFSL